MSGNINMDHLKKLAERADARLDALERRVASAESHSHTTRQEFVLTADGWTADSTVAAYPYKYDLAVTGVTANSDVDARFNIASIALAADYRLCPGIETADGVVSFWAHSKPTATLSGYLQIR